MKGEGEKNCVSIILPAHLRGGKKGINKKGEILNLPQGKTNDKFLLL
jgi:hypothetical protein